VGGNRIIIHYSLTRLLDDLDELERATVGTIGQATENSGETR
jgi:hypothetical protein